MRRVSLLLLSVLLIFGSSQADVPHTVSGGVVGQTTTLSVGGSGTYALFLSLTEGPTSLAALDPICPSQIQLGVDLNLFLFSNIVLTGSAPASIPIPIPADPVLIGEQLFTQAVFLPGPPPCLFADKSNPAAIYFTTRQRSRPSPFPLAVPRVRHTVTPLPDGSWLLAGGTNSLDLLTAGIASAEVLEPNRRQPTLVAGVMSAGHAYHTAVALQSGEVLIAGGNDGPGLTTATVDLYDPATRSFRAAASMVIPRGLHASVTLADGRVLHCGGAGVVDFTPDPLTGIPNQLLNTVLASAEIYDPVANTSTAIANLPEPRLFHSATLLNSGQVLIHGGIARNVLGLPYAPSSCLLFDPAAGRFLAGPRASTGRAYHTAVRLASGDVVVAGGFGVTLIPFGLPVLGSVERYNASANTWTSLGSLINSRVGPDVHELANGDLVILGGMSGGILAPTPLREVERWQSGTTWTHLMDLHLPRGWHTMSVLPDGHLILAGGLDLAVQLAMGDVEFVTL